MSITKIARKPISILKNSTISDVIRMLLNTKISRLIVVENGKHDGISGIFSKTDVIRDLASI